MEALRRIGPTAGVAPLPFTSHMWCREAEPEARPDGSMVERFTANGASRELMRNPSPNAANMLFGGPALRGWQNSRLLPVKEREVHPNYRSLIIREQYRATMWTEDAQGVITETPLTIDPVLGAPKRRTIERFHGVPEGTLPENPEWMRLHELLGTPL